jgi:hypothetical protein
VTKLFADGDSRFSVKNFQFGAIVGISVITEIASWSTDQQSSLVDVLNNKFAGRFQLTLVVRGSYRSAQRMMKTTVIYILNSRDDSDDDN